MTTALVRAIERMTPAEREAATAIRAWYKRQCKAIKRQDSPSIAASLHKAIDERIVIRLATVPEGHQVQCRKGCDACCWQQVSITPHEAQLLARYATEKGVAVDRALLKRQTHAETVEAWRELPPADRRCIFLDDAGGCSVYEHRPSACRKYFVVTDPERCDAVKHPGASVGTLVDLDAEFMHIAALDVYGYGGLPRLVGVALAKLKRRQDDTTRVTAR